MEEVEVKFDVNFRPNTQKLGFLENYAFDNIKGMSDELAEKLRKSMSEGVLSNESVSKLKKRVLDVMDVGKVRAEAIARTESNRAENTGRFDAAIEANSNGIPTKKWIDIADDHRLSHICNSIGANYGSPEKAIPMEQNFKVTVGGKVISAPHPPFHVNCRSRLMIEVQ